MAVAIVGIYSNGISETAQISDSSRSTTTQLLIHIKTPHGPQSAPWNGPTTVQGWQKLGAVISCEGQR